MVDNQVTYNAAIVLISVHSHFGKASQGKKQTPKLRNRYCWREVCRVILAILISDMKGTPVKGLHFAGP